MPTTFPSARRIFRPSTSKQLRVRPKIPKISSSSSREPFDFERLRDFDLHAKFEKFAAGATKEETLGGSFSSRRTACLRDNRREN